MFFTKVGLDKIKKDLKEAEEKRPQAVATLTKARNMGDLSENGFYKGARFELNDLDRKIRNLKHMLNEAKLIEKPHHNDFVQIGHTVTLRRLE